MKEKKDFSPEVKEFKDIQMDYVENTIQFEDPEKK